jgi:hypothetical protein
MIRHRIPFLAAFLSLMTVLPAMAQPDHTVFVAKFFCGFTDGRVPRINDPTPLPAPYRAVEPGNYATVFNMQNVTSTSFTVSPTVSVNAKGYGRAILPARPTLARFDIDSFDCRDITAALAAAVGFPNDGRYVEGYVLINQRPPHDPTIQFLDVTAGYSYAVQKADANGTGLGSSFQVMKIQGQDQLTPE